MSLAAMGPSQTLAADLPGYLNPIPPQIAPVAIPIGWTGIIAGSQVGISNLNVSARSLGRQPRRSVRIRPDH